MYVLVDTVQSSTTIRLSFPGEAAMSNDVTPASASASDTATIQNNIVADEDESAQLWNHSDASIQRGDVTRQSMNATRPGHLRNPHRYTDSATSTTTTDVKLITTESIVVTS